jgi:ATP-dependent helicase/nuclease subunit A
LKRGGWEGERLLIEAGVAGETSANQREHPIAHCPPLPAWLGRAPDWRAAEPPAEPHLPNPLAPSRPDDVAFGPRPASRSPLLRSGGRQRGFEGGLARGRLVHALLQHLPALAPGERKAAARAFARRPSHALPPDEAALLADQALAVLDHPQLADLFGPHGRAEQPLAGLADGVVVTGQVDRMLVLVDRVLLCDFKTGRAAPALPEQTPVLYLRQMAAYRALLARLYPEHAICCLLVWTEGPSVMMLPDELLDLHRPGVRAVMHEEQPA